VLHRVLRIRQGAEHVAAEGEQGSVVAVEERFESSLGARANVRHQAFVRGQSQQGDRQHLPVDNGSVGAHDRISIRHWWPCVAYPER
jgi:hypothetical protein